MILEIYDKNTNNRVDIIRTYDFVQYTKKFNDIGTFSVKVPVSERSLQYLIKNNYILFEKDVMGIIKYIHKEGIEKPYVEIKGYLISHILTYRSSVVTQRYSGEIFIIERSLIDSNFINPTDARREIDLISLEENALSSDTTKYQNTGEDIAQQICSLNSSYDYGWDLVPIIGRSENNQNITSFEFRSYKPVNHTIRNSGGNLPVEFSLKLNNVSELVYSSDSTEEKTVAIVAGEDKGVDRKIEETGDTSATGLNRIELYVDARDIQSTETEEVDGEIIETEIPEQDYRQMLRERGKEKLDEHLTFIEFYGTIIVRSNNLFQFGVDYKLGDYVTVIDDDLNIAADLQITGYTKSLTSNGEIIDMEFGKEKMTLYKRIRNK